MKLNEEVKQFIREEIARQLAAQGGGFTTADDDSGGHGNTPPPPPATDPTPITGG
jgi:hypothetical protein